MYVSERANAFEDESTNLAFLSTLSQVSVPGEFARQLLRRACTNENIRSVSDSPLDNARRPTLDTVANRRFAGVTSVTSVTGVTSVPTSRGIVVRGVALIRLLVGVRVVPVLVTKTSSVASGKVATGTYGVNVGSVASVGTTFATTRTSTSSTVGVDVRGVASEGVVTLLEALAALWASTAIEAGASGGGSKVICWSWEDGRMESVKISCERRIERELTITECTVSTGRGLVVVEVVGVVVPVCALVAVGHDDYM